jgi:hypothetical protein
MTTKQIRDLKVGDTISGIENTVFTEPHTIVKINPALVITDKGGAYPIQQMGHHTVTVVTV